jgi:hypothetical protein
MLAAGAETSWVPGEIVVKLHESALGQLPQDSGENLPVPEFLRAHGVSEVKPAFRRSGRSFFPLERRHGFHRLYRLRVPNERWKPLLPAGSS